MNDIMDPSEMNSDREYFEDKRNLQLEKFNRLIKTGVTFDRIQQCYETLIKMQKQLRLMEDAMIVYRITHANGKGISKIF